MVDAACDKDKAVKNPSQKQDDFHDFLPYWNGFGLFWAKAKVLLKPRFNPFKAQGRWGLIIRIAVKKEKSYRMETTKTALKINEIYLSLQGESTWAGIPCVFVRLTGC